ncbi:MAG: HAMP domain-containing histidine kinase [Flavobacteriaceae bacterium]|nr:HAMP domain-containing histidine kinase [Flavobacteriaceae bacterium]
MYQKKKIKLLTKTSRSFLTYGFIAMLLSIVALFFITRYIIKDETEEALNSEAYRIEKLIENHGELINVSPIINTEKVAELKDQSIKDTLIYDPAEEELEPYKELTTFKRIHNANYKIAIRTRVVELDDILQAIILSYVAIFLTVFLAQYYLSRKSTGQVWKPFFDNLAKIKEFSIQSNRPMNLKETDIEEFSELNDELKNLTDKVISDYQNLKQFTEDVSHEIQTPLAIIQAKIGNLFDENQINEKQYDLLIDISNNARRLALLNKKLILLAKIENQQFKASQKINFAEIVEESIADFDGLSDVTFVKKQMEPTEIYLDSYLARILADNLISNAIKYTPNDGQITIQVTNNQFDVSNSGKKPIADPEKLYSRFYKEDLTKKSLGLGLAIVKKICDTYSFSINYFFKNNLHHFKVDFSKS